MVTKDFSNAFSVSLQDATDSDDTSLTRNLPPEPTMNANPVLQNYETAPNLESKNQPVSALSAGEQFYKVADTQSLRLDSVANYKPNLHASRHDDSAIQIKFGSNLKPRRSLNELLQERVAPMQMRGVYDTIKSDSTELTSLKAANVKVESTLVVNRTLNYTHADAASVRVGVVIFPGTLDDRDAARAIKMAGGRPIPLWHGDETLNNVDAIVIPGGFSYGDYLRCGAISRFAKVMQKVQDAAKSGMPVLGICNGFQVLTESHLLPGALVRNDHQKFICKAQELIVENNETSWTSNFEPSKRITIPLKNGEGRFVADKKMIDKIEAQNQVVFRYAGTNPNGSVNDIAGICNERGNVVGLMPHPEHAVELGFGVDSGKGDGVRKGIDGLTIFQSLIASILKNDTVKEAMRIVEQGGSESV